MVMCGDRLLSSRRLELLQYWKTLTEAGYSPAATYWQMLKQAGVTNDDDLDDAPATAETGNAETETTVKVRMPRGGGVVEG